jgi:signal transduction histidine kinase
MATETTWRPTRRSDAFDVGLAALLGATAGVSLHVGGDSTIFPPDMADYHRPLGIAVVALIVGPLAVRRRFPLAALGVATAAYVPFALHRVPDTSVAPVAFFIALYTAGAYGGHRRDLVRGAATLTIAVLVVEAIVSEGDDYEGRVSLWLVNALAAVQNLFYLASAWLLGDVVRTRRDREATLMGQAEALRAAQADRARRAVVDERVRIARELHDVVAHHVSVMGVQAGAARRVLESRPEAVPELLGSIETSSRQAVGELQRMLGLLRADADSDDRAGAGPQPTIGQLDALVGQMNEAGLAVSTTVEGGTEGLPAAVDLSAYRIVQEALTNTLKHAGAGTAVRVDLRRRPRALEITVADDGRAGGTPGGTALRGVEGDGDGGHHGLVGMRERVALLGGELKVGRARRGGFEVRAWLPLPEGSWP